jgi:hypothetical protein
MWRPARRVTKARNSLGAVVKRVHLGKTYVILEKDGIPLARHREVCAFLHVLLVGSAPVTVCLSTSGHT